jgi:type I restriction enzyme S subunit
LIGDFFTVGSAIEEQQRIAALLDAADELRAKRRQAIAKLDTLTQAIFIDMFGDPKELSQWEIETVESVAHSRKGSIRTGPFGSQLLHDEFVESGVAVLGIDNVVQNRFIPPDKRFITEKKYEELARYKVLAGDVLVTIMGTCGRVAVVPDDVPLAINTKHLCCISPDLEKISPVFLGATLRFDRGVLRQLGATRGAVMPGLNMGLIKHAEFPLPPIGLQHDFERAVSQVSGEQQRAVESLGDMDDLFASFQQRAFRGEL